MSAPDPELPDPELLDPELPDPELPLDPELLPAPELPEPELPLDPELPELPDPLAGLEDATMGFALEGPEPHPAR